MTDIEIEEDSLALKILADEINKTQDRLINLQASYAKLGGIFDGDEGEAKPTKQKLLTGPKPKKKKAKRKSAPPPVERGATRTITVLGKSIEMKVRHCNVVELIQAGSGDPVSKADLVKCFTGRKPNWDQTKKAINAKLAPAGVQIVNVHGQGWKLGKLAP